jgi:hypothetical protein
METLSNTFIPLDSQYGMYKFEIKNIDDIDNDKEILINY